MVNKMYTWDNLKDDLFTRFNGLVAEMSLKDREIDRLKKRLRIALRENETLKELFYKEI